MMDLDSNRGELRVSHPDPGISGAPNGGNSKFPGNVEEHFFEALDEFAYRSPSVSNRNDGVSNQLAGAVVGCSPTPPHPHNGDSPPRKLSLTPEDVTLGCVASERHRRRVLQKEKRVRALVLLSCGGQALLDGDSTGIRHAT